MNQREIESRTPGNNEEILDRTLVIPEAMRSAIQITTEEVSDNPAQSISFDASPRTDISQYDKRVVAHNLIDAFAHVNEQVIGREQLLTQTLHAFLDC